MVYGTKLKELIHNEGYTLTKINKKLNLIHNSDKTVQNLSNKIRRESLSYVEVLEILDIMDYSCVWIPKYKKQNNYNKYKCEIGDDFCNF